MDDSDDPYSRLRPLPNVLYPSVRAAAGTPSTGVPEGRTSDRRRHPARGYIPGETFVEPVRMVAGGRDKGGKIYVSREILDAALVKARLPSGTPIAELEVTRRVMGGRRHIAQVLLEIRVRKGATP